MTAIEKLKSEYPDVIFAPKFRGDGILIIDLNVKERSIAKALSSEEMTELVGRLKKSEDSANDYLYSIMKGMVKEIEN